MSEQVTENGFVITFWKGQKRYHCPLFWESGAPCMFDHYSLDELFEHMKEPHNRLGKEPRKAPQRVSPIVDADGKPIFKEVPADLQHIQFQKEE